MMLRQPWVLNSYLNHYNLSKQYYSFDYLNIHFVILSTYIPYQKDSEQYTFLINDLSNAISNPNIDWIIVAYHRAAYIPTTIDN